MSNPTEEADTTQNMGDLLDSVAPLKPLRRGDVVKGVVMRLDHEGLFVNVGHKAEGFVPPTEMKTIEQDTEKPDIGDEIVAFVIKDETAEDAAILSIDKAVGEKGWTVLESALEDGSLVKGTILGFNRGGSIVESEGVQAFVPMSQLVSVSRDVFQEISELPTRDTDISEETETKDSDSDSHEDPESIGKVLDLKVLEVNRSRNRAILSERQAAQSMREHKKAELIKELSVGEVRSGKVTGISNFGAFVDLGGADGLVHISELSWFPVNSPEEIVQVGQDVNVYVLRVDSENNKIALSLKRLQREPWETINDHIQVDEIVDATVTKLTDFGAFAKVDNSVEGLIHISELSSKMIGHPREIVSEGDAVRVKVLRIEPERRRLGLSLKQAQEEEYS